MIKRFKIWLMHKLAGQCLDCVVCGGCMIDPPERHSYEACADWVEEWSEDEEAIPEWDKNREYEPHAEG